MVGDFRAAAVPAQTSSPVFPLAAHVTVCLVKTCASLYLTLFLQSHLDFVVGGIWVIRIFASGCVTALEEDWVRQTPPRGRATRAATGRVGCKPSCLTPRHLKLLLLKKKKQVILFLKSLLVIYSKIGLSNAFWKLWWESSAETWARREPAVWTAVSGAQRQDGVASSSLDTQEGIALARLLGGSLWWYVQLLQARQHSSASSSAAKWYLNSELTGFDKVSAQQKGCGMWSSACQESPEIEGVIYFYVEGGFPQKCLEGIAVRPHTSTGVLGGGLPGKAAL